MVQKIPAALLDTDVPTSSSIVDAIAVEVTARNTAISTAVLGSSNLVQRVNTQTGTMSTFSALIPADDTIPQISEGTEILTVTITPKTIGNILVIDTHLMISAGAATTVIAALFQDASANALACAMQIAAANSLESVRIRYTMAAASVAATTFRLRAGVGAAATVTVNGSAGARYLGGVMLSSISVTELKP